MSETFHLFIVPGATREDQEAVFAELARFAGRTAPQHSERLYSITFDHKDEEWLAMLEKLASLSAKPLGD